MRIDVSDQLFHDLSKDEAEELAQWAEAVVLRGEVTHPSWIDEWMEVMGFDSRQALLLISTALPQKVLLSVVRYYQEGDVDKMRERVLKMDFEGDEG